MVNNVDWQLIWLIGSRYSVLRKIANFQTWKGGSGGLCMGLKFQKACFPLKSKWSQYSKLWVLTSICLDICSSCLEVPRLGAGLDVCSFVQLTSIYDKTAFFVSFNSLTKHFSIIGDTCMPSRGGFFYQNKMVTTQWTNPGWPVSMIKVLWL